MTRIKGRTVITIDGLSASGKSTLAKLLSRQLGFFHVNTGLLYRASAFLALKEHVCEQSASELVSMLSRHQLAFAYSDQAGCRLLIDGQDYSEHLQSQEVASLTSKIAAIPELRETLKEMQVGAFPDRPIVSEGRDQGTIIFPEATVKFFIVGDPLIRAQRRAFDLGAINSNNLGAVNKGAVELKEQFSESELKEKIKEVAQELQERDQRDSTRLIAPLKQADDAILIDNTVGTLDETLKKMVEAVKNKI